MVVKTFRGLLADGGQERICLETLRGKVGYRIVKFQMIGPDSNENIESTMKIYMDKQTTINDDINFSDNRLLAAGILLFPQHSSNTAAQTIVFDSVVFNQDIYITLSGHGYQSAINYYLELEVIPLTDHAAEFTTLKDIRGRTDLVAKPTP